MTGHRIPRAALGALLLLAILLPATFAMWRSGPADPHPLETFLKAQGLRDVKPSTWDSEQDVLDVSIPRCPGRAQILGVSSLLEDQDFIERHLSPGNVRTFVYVDKSWTTLNHFKVWIAYARAEARNVVRRRPLSHLDTIIETVAPPHCDGLASIDWRGFWE